MKFKYFSILIFFIFLFSITTVVASEDITNDNNDELSINVNDEIVENQDILTATSSNEGDVDLSINVDVKNAYNGNQYNRAGFEVPWNITASVTGGTAHNTKVRSVLSNTLEYLSYSTSVGTYNSTTGIWDIGDLNSSNNATLTILTKLKTEGRFKLTVNATTDSNDVNLTNNFLVVSIKTGSSKITSNTTETSDDKEGAQHTTHYLSTGTSSREKVVINSSKSNSKQDYPKTKDNVPSGFNSSSGSKKSVSKSLIKSMESNSNMISKAYSSLKNVFDASGDDSIDDDSSDSSNQLIEIIPPYNYIRFPLLILASFLAILGIIFVYDKIKF